MMGRILKGIDGERFPLIGNVKEYNVTFAEGFDIASIKEDEIQWQVYWSTKFSEYEIVPFSGQKKGRKTTYKFLLNLLNKNLQIKATYKGETVELHVMPQANGEIKIIDVFFLDLNYEILKEIPKYFNSINLQIYTLNMLGRVVEFKIYDVVAGQEIEVAKSSFPLRIIQKNGMVKTKQAVLLNQGMAMQTHQDLSAPKHNYKIKVWESRKEENFYEEELNVKNESGSFSVPKNSQSPIKTGTTETVKPKDEEENKFTCGIQYRNSITCVKYGSKNTVYGPLYFGSLKLTLYKKWNTIVTSGKITIEEKEIILAMSENEGNMDAVQSYDSEILTAGAMQKTINPDGYGELSIQLWEFKQEYPDKFKTLFEDCGWDVKEIKIVQKDKKIIKKYQSFYNEETGNDLKKTIRKGFEEKKYKQKVICIPMEPFINACKDEDFQTKQITDFIVRLNIAINKKPTGYSYKIQDFVKTKLGKATVLDQDVNRPGHVSNCFADALNQFFSSDKKISRNPSDWKESHEIYEKQILEIYGPLRGKGKYTMTDAFGRYIKLKSRL